MQYQNEWLTLDFKNDVAVPYLKFEMNIDNLVDKEAEELGITTALK